MVQHRVADYDAWRKAHDQIETTHKTGGVTHQSVHRAKSASGPAAVQAVTLRG
jgi:hypothetical protein